MKMNPTSWPVAALFALCILGSRSVSAKETPENAKLEKMTAPYEVLAETILTGDPKDAMKVERAYARAENQKAETKPLLTPENAAAFEAGYNMVQEARARKDSVGVALAAAEVFKLLVNSMNAETLVVPKEAGLLDYVGFRASALLKEPTVRWSALEQNAREAASAWKKIQARITHQGLHAAVDSAVQGMRSAAAAHDTSASQASATRVLDLVDELEHFFEGGTVKVD